MAPAVTNFILRQHKPRLFAYQPGDSPSAMRANGLSGSATSLRRMLCLLHLLFISLDPSTLIRPDLSSRSPNRFASIHTRRVMQNAAQRRKEADEARLKKKEELME